MQDYYILWTYQANYSDKPLRIRARNAQDAIKSFTKFYSDDFQKKATVYAFTELPASMWKRGSIVNQSETTETE